MGEKVTILTPFYYPNIGGAETFCAALHKELSKVYDTSVCTIKWNKQKIWKGMDFIGSIFVSLKLAIAMIKDKYWLSKEIYAIGLNAGFVASKLAKNYSVTLLALYDFSNPVLRKQVKKILQNARCVFVEGKTGRDNLACLDLPNIIEFTHWVDKIDPVEKLEEEYLKVLFIGRPIKEKGKHIIEAAQKLCSIGAKKIRFYYVENIEHSLLAELYKMADVLVVPSLYPEGHTRVVIEAASFACAIITSDQGALPEQVKEFGLSIPATANAFYNTLSIFEGDRRSLEMYKFKAYSHALKYFSNRNAEVFL